MGTKHNSHVFNDSNHQIIATLTDTNNRNAQIFLQPGEVQNIPTEKGSITLTCHIVGQGTKGSVVYTDQSDRSFIVRDRPDGGLQIFRAEYGTVRDVEDGLRT